MKPIPLTEKDGELLSAKKGNEVLKALNRLANVQVRTVRAGGSEKSGLKVSEENAVLTLAFRDARSVLGSGSGVDIFFDSNRRPTRTFGGDGSLWLDPDTGELYALPPFPPQFGPPVTWGSPVSNVYFKRGTFTPASSIYRKENGTWLLVWASFVPARVLVCAGGGGGGSVYGGGGGGGYASEDTSFQLDASTTYTVTVGSGGAGAVDRTVKGTNGNDSSFDSITVSGGGGGGSWDNRDGAAGGCGGGGGNQTTMHGAGGTGTPGGSGGNGDGDATSSAGGGGGGAAPQNGTNAAAVNTGGTGGNGLLSDIDGTSRYYGSGGGGCGATGVNYGEGGAGSYSGGGQGGSPGNTFGKDASNNTGGGGGGGGFDSGPSFDRPGGVGGSGIVIVRYAGPQKYTGGTVTTVGGDYVHTFTASGSLTPI